MSGFPGGLSGSFSAIRDCVSGSSCCIFGSASAVYGLSDSFEIRLLVSVEALTIIESTELVF